MDNLNIIDWSVSNVTEWARSENLNDIILNCIECEQINGKCILLLNEYDLHELREKCKNCNLKLGHTKLFWLSIRNLQRINSDSLIYLGLQNSENVSIGLAGVGGPNYHHPSSSDVVNYSEIDRISPPISIDGRATSIQPEFFKTMISLGMYLNFLIYFIYFFI